ncbi:hypothetical protein J2T57_002879 [Natronocella acetinitrilica]|jgi:hypothetical protein|uniref:PRC-barrel domain-containing protein n=1 Tax=Natronocella acetinitrilica TaxID=414046 RepID=A0AAE3KCE7_9GAMM|nr:PRC-barrel domain-containing protein [Natronocella acetinitrilica]MCP1675724.1 hypothetical protein [Natronocella acetinitrilica]
MTKSNGLKLTAAMVPLIMFGIASTTAWADDDLEREERDQDAATHTESSEAVGPTDMTSDEARAQGGSDEKHVSRRPDQSYYASELMGHAVKHRSDDQSIGDISNLVIDQDGQVLAVVMRSGGTLGIGERQVAISWDDLERTIDGDDLSLYIDMDAEALERVPAYGED